MTTATETILVYINDGPAMAGELNIDQETQQILSSSAKPDTRWTFTDSHGHYHAHSDEQDEPYPTLQRHVEREECDGSCGGTCDGEGFPTVRYTCLICDEDVKPGAIPGPHRYFIPGLKSWTVRAHGLVKPSNEKVSVRVEVDGLIYFGVAMPTEAIGEGYAGITTYVSTLQGVGPLGRRKA